METLQTLERGMAALELIAKQHGQINVAQLAEQLALNRTITYRITRTLSSLGYIKTNEQQFLELTSKISTLYHCFEKTIPTSSQYVLNILAKQTNASASLVIAEGSDCVVAKTASSHAEYLQINYQLGSRLPIGLAASGIAIASTFAPHQSESDEIKQARQLGYAYSESILQHGAIGLFMPIPNRHMAVGIVHLGEIDKDVVLNYLKEARDALI